MEASTRVVAPAGRPLTKTERNWLKALAIVVGSTLLAGGVMLLENRFGHSDRFTRVVYNPVETAMRMLALPHFVIAILFMTTSRAMRTPRSWAWFVGYAALGVVLCWLFHAGGGLTAAIPRSLFLGYFLVHEFRDQAFFYRMNGDEPRLRNPEAERRNLMSIPAIGLVLIFTVFLFGAAFQIGGARRYTAEFFGPAPAWLRYGIGIAGIALAIAMIHRTRRRIERTHPGGVPGFLRDNRPMLLVFGGILGVLLLDIVLTGRAYAIVTLHVATWYVFVSRAYQTRPALDPAPRPLSWAWLRATGPGFQWLHQGLLILVIGLAFVWAYAFDNSASQKGLWLLLSRNAFPFWTIMHVSLSWTPK